MELAVGTTEGDEVARLCVSKLRAMLVVQGDPNLRYVALLAFAKITASHADLVADHQDAMSAQCAHAACLNRKQVLNSAHAGEKQPRATL